MYTTWIKMKSEVMCYPWARSWEYRMKITANQEHRKSRGALWEVEGPCGKRMDLVRSGGALSEVEGSCQKGKSLVGSGGALWELLQLVTTCNQINFPYQLVSLLFIMDSICHNVTVITKPSVCFYCR